MDSAFIKEEWRIEILNTFIKCHLGAPDGIRGEGANEETEEDIEKMFGNIESPDAPCSTNKLIIQNNVVSIKSKDSGGDNDYEPGF